MVQGLLDGAWGSRGLGGWVTLSSASGGGPVVDRVEREKWEAGAGRANLTL